MTENPLKHGRSRIVVWFSCGAASAVAAKLASEKYKDQDLHVVYCDTLASEHPDNRRFLADVENWIGKEVEIIKSEDYDSIDDVFERTRYMSGIAGARCTVEMKKKPRYDYERLGDTHIFGLTLDEEKRITRFTNNNPNLRMDWILKENGINKQRCYQIVREAGISLPVMYSLGFKNNNCIGCVKSTSGKYWNRVRKYFPEVFQKRCDQSRKINVRLVIYKGKRIFLDELTEDKIDGIEEDIECGTICVVEREQEG